MLDWTWDEVGEQLTLPRIAAYSKAWKKYPSRQLLLQMIARWEPKKYGDLGDLLAMAGQNGGKI